MFKKSITAILLSTAVVLFVLFFFSTRYGILLEYKAIDSIQRAYVSRNPAHSDSLNVVIVAIDDESFQSLEVQWPFPREYYIRLIENLNRAGAKLIVFDIEFSERYNQDVDTELGLIAKKYKNVIFAGKIYQIKDVNYTRTTILPPINDITKTYPVWGLVNMSNDMDGFVRNYPLFLRTGALDEYIYSLGLQSLRMLNIYPFKINSSYRNIIFDDKKINYSFQNDIKIHYYGPAKTFPHFSFSSVIDDSSFVLPMEEFFPVNDFYHLLENEVFKDKIVLIGATVDELKDNFLSPVNRPNELLPGVEIHANMIQMLIDKRFIHIFPVHLYYIIVLIITSFLSFLFIKQNPFISLLITLILLILSFLTIYKSFEILSVSIPILPLLFSIVTIYMLRLILNFIHENKEKKIIKKTFQHYMAPALVKELLKSPENLKYGGALKEITVLFSDIRSFTTYTESHKVEETVTMLKEYLTEMVNTIIDNQGILDKFVGDEIMALFNTPVNIENHPLKACICALQMVDKLKKLQDKWKSEGREIIEIGIGVNTGLAVVGNLGSEQIFDYTAIGDTINLGARLEALNKNYNTSNHIIISEFTLNYVKDYINYEYLDQVVVKGKSIPVKIYHLSGLKE